LTHARLLIANSAPHLAQSILADLDHTEFRQLCDGLRRMLIIGHADHAGTQRNPTPHGLSDVAARTRVTVQSAGGPGVLSRNIRIVRARQPYP
jgi:hypothetical protein